MSFVIRTMKVPDDYEGVARLMSLHYSEPMTVERLQEEDANIPLIGSLSRDDDGRLAGHDRIRYVALDGKGQIAGYGIAWRAPWSPAGTLFCNIIVDPAKRRSGIGGAIYETLEAYVQKAGADCVVYDVRDSEPDSLRFAEVRGFAVERHRFESLIELERYSFDEAESAAAAVTAVSAENGIRFATLAELPGEEAERALYELYRQTNPDIPGAEGEFMWYSEWRKWAVDRKDFDPSLVLLALDGLRPVGAVELIAIPATQSLYNEYTCVDRDYRSRGVATALKRRSIEVARQRGYRYIRTHNDSLNAPMLAINRKLGYKPVPGFYKMVRNVRK
ncbi:GNAT family N-acetyltransferase [Paenibacillus sp. H1-7]|uniref:GNAT family N-acetyltransferase n=1 Tax=Paenibacillus sp. H1-7 TaxID=2282849 RepID=UPI001EF799F9|nr:GNAT family N-acetyltransferase [Paenibacillus sp. H1-7]ULL18501.1 GNAT family N-acetyltransferase [Paenibacillus sp. H1-7]